MGMCDFNPKAEYEQEMKARTGCQGPLFCEAVRDVQKLKSLS